MLFRSHPRVNVINKLIETGRPQSRDPRLDHRPEQGQQAEPHDRADQPLRPEDGEAALRWMKVHYPDVPIVIYAQSLGGAIALRNAIDLRAEVPVRAVVIDSSFASYQVVGRRILSKNFLTWPLQWLPWILLSDRFAPDGQIQKISPIPLLVMHAENDQTVPFRCGEELFEQAGNPKDFWRISGEGHVDAFLRFGDFYQNKLDLWFSQALARSPQ